MNKPNSDSKHHAELIVNEQEMITGIVDTDFFLDLVQVSLMEYFLVGEDSVLGHMLSSDPARQKMGKKNKGKHLC